MIWSRIYYYLKPMVSAPARMTARRLVAFLKRRSVASVWPIFPGSESQPEDWPGWPNNKRFAFVLTHDVEGIRGLEKCRQLAELEKKLGFRSSFNFIPEGNYKVCPELLSDLTGDGFEVGVHDLCHDGKLYRGRDRFRDRAHRINHYLKQWNAVGFRSGFMLHKLGWLHDLDIAYDASTFDTDPYEPQPDGYRTIFPFWVPPPENEEPAARSNGDNEDSSNSQISTVSSARRGYVELPYTLPQDSTLFLLLREKTPAIWLRKLDWIAEKGGMALVNVHPDYINFGDKAQSEGTYDVAHYECLLNHVRDRYGDLIWQPLPRQIAGFVSNLKSRPVNPYSKRVAMVTHSIYLRDNRVRRYAEALAARGDHVDVFALRQNVKQGKQDVIGGVNLFRIQDRFEKSERSKLAYLFPLLRFMCVASTKLTREHLRKRYDAVHIHNIPDFLVFSAWFLKLAKVPVILDIHDIVPEFFASKFRVAPHSVVTTLLRWMERLSARFADRIIIANHLWLNKYAIRTGVNGRCCVFINNVDTDIFVSGLAKDGSNKQIILYPGGLQWHQGVDIALRAFKIISAELPNSEFHIYGDGSAKVSLLSLTAELNLNNRVKFFEPRPVHEIAGIMGKADLGVVPKRADSFGNEAYSTKIMEFMAVGVPVVVSSTQVDRFYFDDSIVRFFKSGDVNDLACQMLKVLQNRELARSMVARAAQFAARNCWNTRKKSYLDLVDSLCLNN